MTHRDSPSRRFRRQETRTFALLLILGLFLVAVLVFAASRAV